MKNSKIVIVIPSFNPDEKTIQYVNDLIAKGFENIIIIDDGSKKECEHYFTELKDRKECIVLKQAINSGKGRALKTGFNYYLNHFDKHSSIGVITADADGQHSAEDTEKVVRSLLNNPESLILGTRDFNEENVPFKSKVGNKLTTIVFSILYSKKINDTQTGLRGIPYDLIGDCIRMKGERFEYEINMLIETTRRGNALIEERIETIYFDSNRETHFDVVKDSIRIYSVIFKSFFKFVLAGLSSSVIDLLLFALLTKLIFSNIDIKIGILIGTILSRLVSSFFNYSVNKNVVFKDKSQYTVIKYYILCVLQMTASWILVTGVYTWLYIDTTVIKVMVDFMLFLISFQVQRRWVFRVGGKKI